MTTTTVLVTAYLAAIVAWQPWNEWGRAVVVKIDYTLWQR